VPDAVSTAYAGAEGAGRANDSTVGAVLRKLDEQTRAILDDFRQGDLLPGVTSIPVAGDDGQPQRYPAPDGAVMLSQTCDVTLADRLAVQVAPLVRLPEPSASEARGGKRPRYVHVPAVGPTSFADLEIIGTLTKPYLATRTRTPGVVSDDEIRRFGRAIARRFGRFAFPDEVVPWLAPLQDVVASKAVKPASPEGQALAHVVETAHRSRRRLAMPTVRPHPRSHRRTRHATDLAR
jgi:hypothetical protein